MSFLYAVFLKLLYPTSLSLFFLGLTVILRKRKRQRLACFCIAVIILVVCGNGWLVGALTKHLEWQNLPLDPVPRADAILVLSGGLFPRIPPRPTAEVGEAGDRLLYGANLFRQGKAPYLVCAGSVATGGIAPRPAAEEMAEFLQLLGIGSRDIITEIKSQNTHEHAQNLAPVFQTRGFTNVLLVTSAVHMPRALATFRRHCPGINFIPAPTDFRVTKGIPVPWYRHVVGLIPTPRHLVDFSEVMHEYLGIVYYRLRGWL